MTLVGQPLMDAYQLSSRQVPSPCNPDDVLRALAESLRSKSMVFFFGSGLSREYPSLCPTSWSARTDVLPGLISLLADAMIRHVPSMDTEDRGLIGQQFGRLGLEQILEHLTVIVGSEALDFLDILQRAPGGLRLGPNYRHYALGLLAKGGYCRHFITLNFDTFTEEAFERLGVPLIIPEKAEDEGQSYRNAGRASDVSGPFLYKLHGTLEDKRTVLTTVEAIGMGLPEHKKALLSDLMTANDGFFIGYSDNDVDVFPHLKKNRSNRCIFWHFLTKANEDRKGKQRNILEHLAGGPNYILFGSVDHILQKTLAELGISDREILSMIGVKRLEEIEMRDRAEAPGRRTELQRFRDEAIPKWLTREMATMALTNIIPPMTSEGKNLCELRERLFASIRPERLSGRVRHTYLVQKAERFTNEGFRSEAIAAREQALRELEWDPRRDDFYRHAACEQSIRLANDYRSRFLRRPRLDYFFQAVISWWRARQLVARQKKHLARRDAVRFCSMLNYTWPRFWHGIVEWLVLLELRRKVRGKHSTVGAWIIRGLLGWWAAIAERAYRRCMEFDYGAGWKALIMHQLAEVILHRKQRVTEDVNRLLERVHWRTRPNWEGDSGSMAQERLGAFEGLRSVYKGEIRCAKRILNETYRYYVKTKHRSGKVKTLLFLALCYEKEGKYECARKILAARDRVAGGFR